MNVPWLRPVMAGKNPGHYFIEHCTNYGTLLMWNRPILFLLWTFIVPMPEMSRYVTGSKSFPRDDKRIIGEDVKTAQLGWPLGMPLIRKMDKNLWEIRSSLPDGIARVLFTVDGSQMILLHGFIKKSNKTPQNELNTATTRLGNYWRNKQWTTFTRDQALTIFWKRKVY